jgi:hypothetical protein
MQPIIVHKRKCIAIRPQCDPAVKYNGLVLFETCWVLIAKSAHRSKITVRLYYKERPAITALS